MERALTLNGRAWLRFWSFIAGAGMVVASVLTIRHFFNANFPLTIFSGSFCDISPFFNCDSSAYSPIAHFKGVPLGYFGLILGALVILGALFPSAVFERTNKSLSLLNGIGVVALFVYSVFFLKSLCLFCAGYYLFSLLSLFLFWKYGLTVERRALLGTIRAFLAPSLKYLFVFAVITVVGAYGFHLFYAAKQDAQTGGVATRVVKEYYTLAEVKNPSLVSPFWTAKATERFDDAPIRVIEYADLLCPDCWYLNEQLKKLKKEYQGKINIAFQFFPLEAKCNTVVEKIFIPAPATFLSLRLLTRPSSTRFTMKSSPILPKPKILNGACSLRRNTRLRQRLTTREPRIWSSRLSIPEPNTRKHRRNSHTASAPRQP